MSEQQHTTKACPYWAPANQQPCTTTVGGLYVPLPEHVTAFCRTSRWEECPQYTRGYQALRKLMRMRGIIRDQGRRAHERFVGRHPVTISAAEQAAAASRILDDTSWTVDLSMGGMRIETAAELPGTAPVTFAFGADFLVPGLTGRAEVRWQRPTEGSGRYQYGLRFLEASRALGDTLSRRT